MLLFVFENEHIPLTDIVNDAFFMIKHYILTLDSLFTLFIF
jgi:hypothetical protein